MIQRALHPSPTLSITERGPLIFFVPCEAMSVRRRATHRGKFLRVLSLSRVSPWQPFRPRTSHDELTDDLLACRRSSGNLSSARPAVLPSVGDLATPRRRRRRRTDCPSMLSSPSARLALRACLVPPRCCCASRWLIHHITTHLLFVCSPSSLGSCLSQELLDLADAHRSYHFVVSAEEDEETPLVLVGLDFLFLHFIRQG